MLDISNPFILIWVVFMSAFILYRITRKNGKYANIVVLSVGAITLSFSMFFTEILFTDNDMSMAVLDVGQGQSIIISSGTFTAMVDCGETDIQVQETLLPNIYSAKTGLRWICSFLLTHTATI